MVDKNININAKVNAGQAVSGIKQLADAMKKLKNYKQEFSKGNIFAGIIGGATVNAFNAIGKVITELVDRIKEFGVESSKTSMKYDGLMNRFNAAAGGIRSGTESWIFMKNLSKELGISFVETSESFGTFEAAALRSGLSMDQTQQIFSDISTAIVSLQLDSYRTGLSFMALSQMASKGTVQMEELKRQLGESLPGAVQIGARAMGMSNAEFHKMVEEGKILSKDFLPKFAEQVKKELGGSVGVASKQARAELTRFSNAMMDLKDSLGDLINNAIVPFLRIMTPMISNLSLTINKTIELEKATGDLKDTLESLGKSIVAILAVAGFGGLFKAVSNIVLKFGLMKLSLDGLVTVFKTFGRSLLTTKISLDGLITVLRAFGSSLLTTKNVWAALAVAIGFIVFQKDQLNKKSNENLNIAKEAVKKNIEETNSLKKLENEMSPIISEYESLRRTKNRTNEQQKRFIDLQKTLISTFPSMKSGIEQQKSVIALFADAYTKLGKEALIAKKSMLIASIKDDFEKNIDDPISEVQKRTAPKLKEIKQINDLLKTYDTQGTVEIETGTGDDESESELRKAARLRKKQYDDEIKFEENNLNLKLAKGRFSEDELNRIKQESLKNRLEIAQKYYTKESDLLNKADFKQDIEKIVIEEFNLKKDYDNKRLANSISILDQLQKETLSIENLTELQQLQIQKSTNASKIALLNDFINKTGTKEEEYINQLRQLKAEELELEKQINNQKIKDHNKLIDDKISAIEILSDREIRIGNKTEKEKLDIQISADKKILELLEQRLSETYDQSIKNAEDIAKKRIEIEENEQKQKQRLTNKYGGRYGVSFRERLQETIDQMPDISKWEEFWKDFANVAADAVDNLSQKISDSLADNIEKILDGTQTLKEGFKAFYEDIKQTVRRMVAEIIAEMITLYVIKPFLEDIFGSIFGRKRQGGGTTMLTGLTSGLGLLGFANGGVPPIGVPSIVGERGPELFIPKQSGTIVPNHKLGGGTSNYVYAPNIKTGASADEVFAILDKHSRKFFAMIQDGIENNSGLRNAVRVGS